MVAVFDAVHVRVAVVVLVRVWVRLTVGDLMTRSVHTIRPEMRVGQAIHLMTQHGITSLPVVSAHGHLLGMISDSQLLPLVVRPELADDSYVERVAPFAYDSV
jgi:CBS domain-containing protein